MNDQNLNFFSIKSLDEFVEKVKREGADFESKKCLHADYYKQTHCDNYDGCGGEHCTSSDC